MSIYAPLNTETTPILQKVEVATFFQLPSFHLVGLPGPEVSESKERVRAAIDSSQLPFPKGKVVVNLSPAEIKKRGTGLDLAVALGVLSSALNLKSTLGAWGELGLDGSVKPAGQLTRSLYAAWVGGVQAFLLPQAEITAAQEALECVAQSGEMTGVPPVLIPVKTLKEAWEKLSDWKNGPPPRLNEPVFSSGRDSFTGLGGVKRQGGEDSSTLSTNISVSISATDSATTLATAQSDALGPQLLPLTPALERLVGWVVAGKHHFLILGPRGVGKSQLVEWMISLQPELAPSDRLRQRLLLELAQMSSHALENQRENRGVPVRWVGPQVRPGALVGGCISGLIRPGEYSLASGGLLIADEFPEWNRDSRESLREPLERRKISVTRAHGSFELPSEFQFVGTGNLCPCGGWPAQFGASSPLGDSEPQSAASVSAAPLQSASPSVTRCRCSSTASSAYFGRLSGPILDRMDCVLVWRGRSPSDPVYSMSETQERLIALRARVDQSQRFAIANWGGPPGRLRSAEVEAILNEKHSESWNRFLQSASVSSSEFSLRARHKVARVALSLAAWDNEPEPSWAHWMEASLCRPEKAYEGL